MSRQCLVADSVTAFTRDEWNRCFPAEVENWDYYRSVERADIANFSWHYFAITENGKLLAAAPGFRTIYRLDTTAQGITKRIAETLMQLFPKLLSLPLLCLGSPVTETCHLGFAPEIDAEEKRTLLGHLMGHFKQYARQHCVGLVAVKDVRNEDAPLLRSVTTDFATMAGLPTAVLYLPFRSFDDYLKSLSRATRKDMRRKIRIKNDIRIERRETIDDITDLILRLYEETVARSDLQFEHLPVEYFTAVLANMPKQARCVLYWHGTDLLAFNLLLESPECLVDKFIGTAASARDYNLYFLSWMENVRYCIASGIPAYQSGQASYAVKVRLGSQLFFNWNYFLHTNPVLNTTLQLIARLVRLDRFDPKIRAAIHGIK